MNMFKTQLRNTQNSTPENTQVRNLTKALQNSIKKSHQNRVPKYATKMLKYANFLYFLSPANI
jgi:NAD dependent epimerase/dehydratase family enzyme